MRPASSLLHLLLVPFLAVLTSISQGVADSRESAASLFSDAWLESVLPPSVGTEVERVDARNLDWHKFERVYLMSSRPVVIHGLAEGWTAPESWRTKAHFAAMYNSCAVAAASPSPAATAIAAVRVPVSWALNLHGALRETEQIIVCLPWTGMAVKYGKFGCRQAVISLGFWHGTPRWPTI